MACAVKTGYECSVGTHDRLVAGDPVWPVELGWEDRAMDAVLGLMKDSCLETPCDLRSWAVKTVMNAVLGLMKDLWLETPCGLWSWAVKKTEL